MGEIRLNVARMKELISRVAEMIEQLGTSFESSNESINKIQNNIKGSILIDELSKYSESCNNICNETRSNLYHLYEYLIGTVNKYSTTEQEAADVIADVQSILQGLE